MAGWNEVGAVAPGRAAKVAVRFKGRLPGGKAPTGANVLALALSGLAESVPGTGPGTLVVI